MITIATRGTLPPYLLAPVHTIFPELKTRAVVRGSLIRMITAANRCRRKRGGEQEERVKVERD